MKRDTTDEAVARVKVEILQAFSSDAHGMRVTIGRTIKVDTARRGSSDEGTPGERGGNGTRMTVLE